MGIDDSLLELSGRDLAVEQDIRLTVRTVLELRKTKVGRNKANNSSASPDITTLASHVPASGVEELGGEVDHGDLSNVVCGTANTGAESTETHRGRLGNDGV